eukprot:357135-Chlamydomonas_euryale.AAC.1
MPHPREEPHANVTPRHAASTVRVTLALTASDLPDGCREHGDMTAEGANCGKRGRRLPPFPHPPSPHRCGCDARRAFLAATAARRDDVAEARTARCAPLRTPQGRAAARKECGRGSRDGRRMGPVAASLLHTRLQLLHRRNPPLPIRRRRPPTEPSCNSIRARAQHRRGASAQHRGGARAASCDSGPPDLLQSRFEAAIACNGRGKGCT